MLVISELGRLRQKDNYKFETSVGYVVNYGAAWANE